MKSRLGLSAGFRTLVGAGTLLLGFGCGASDAGGPAGSNAGSVGNSAGAAGGSTLAGGSGGAAAASGGATMSSAGHGGVSSSALDPHGLGAPCEGDTDCSAQLSCHSDPTDYIDDMQCSLYCTSDGECTSKFGSGSFCIGAHQCVKSCTSDDDCAAKTHCISAGWCERGGPGSGLPYCGGTATPCAALADLQCGFANGCRNNAKCSGLATSCYSLFDSSSCYGQQGCSWDSLSKSCGGIAEDCSLQPGMATCGLQQGCAWSGGCEGVPAACSTQFVSLCTNQPGCSLMTN